MSNMKVVAVKGTNLIDVFNGEGWEGWSRYKKVINRTTKRAIYVFTSGNRLNTEQLKDLYTKVKK